MTRRDKGLKELGERLRQEEPEEMPQFPDIMPTSLKKTKFWEIWEEDLATPDDVELLLRLMFDNPESPFHLFNTKGGSRPAPLSEAFQLGLVRTAKMQGHWYEHPLYPNNFIQILPPTNWDWEKEVLEKGQPLLRFEIVLTDRERRRRENQDTALAVAEATLPTKPEGWYARVTDHYSRHQAVYYGIGAILAVVGIALSM